MSDYGLRPATLRDVETLHRDCWPEQTLTRVQARLRRVIQQGAYGRMVGLVAVSADDPDCPVAYGQVTRWTRLAEISDLVVTERWRNHGIGTALITAFIAQARAWGSTQVEIGAAERNTRALALYERMGFAPYRTLTLDLGEGDESVIYLIQALG